MVSFVTSRRIEPMPLTPDNVAPLLERLSTRAAREKPGPVRRFPTTVFWQTRDRTCRYRIVLESPVELFNEGPFASEHEARSACLQHLLELSVKELDQERAA